MLDIDPLHDGPTPLPAATVVLLRDGASGLEVLLVQRHRSTAFMGGAYVFPGGKLDEGDRADELVPFLERQVDDAALLAALGPSETIDPSTARALHVAAARETFEEAGVLLGAAPVAEPGALGEARARLNGGEGFGSVLRSIGARIDLRRLVPLSRWITPAVERKRFDARFFLAALREDEAQAASNDAKETIGWLWATPAEAIARHIAAAIDLPPPTLRTLELLRDMPSAEAALGRTRASSPPLVRPVFRAPDSGWLLTLPGDPEHPEPAAVLGGSTRFVCRDGRWFSE